MELILRFLLFLYKNKYIPTGMQFSILLLLMLNIKNTLTYKIYFKNVNFRQSVKISNCSLKEAKFYYSTNLQSSRNRVVLAGRNSCPGGNTPHVQFVCSEAFLQNPWFYRARFNKINLGQTVAVLVQNSLCRASSPLLFQVSKFKSLRHSLTPSCISDQRLIGNSMRNFQKGLASKMETAAPVL